MSYPHPLTPEEKLADAKKQLSLPRIVVICGSTRFMTEMTYAFLPLKVVGLIAPTPGDQRNLLDLYELGEQGAVLVRPDGHVAWRTTNACRDAADELISQLANRWKPFGAAQR